MRTIFLLPFFLISSALIQAQSLSAFDVSKKWGKVAIEELAMTDYPKDTSARAVVLNRQRFTTYEYRSNTGFHISHFISEKIKILKAEGKDEGSIEIPYYYKSNANRETVTGLEAASYNLVNGKIVKTKLDKDYLFDEEINKSNHRIKFSLPEVKIGTVIEYKYTIETERVYFLPDWDIQRDIPILNSDFEVRIPEYFKYNIAVKGLELLDIKDGAENVEFNLGNDQNGSPVFLTCTMRKIRCIAQDIPALKAEDYVWCLDDYISGLRFELKGTHFPNELYKPFTSTWEDLEKTIEYETDMPQFLKISNPWKEATAKILTGITDEEEKITVLYDFVKKQIRWNESYALIGDNPKEALKNGTGSNAQINYLLMSVLRDAGIRTYPILLSRRNNGRLPYAYPSLNKLSTFIVAAVTKDSTVFYLDGSSKYGGPNILPTGLLVDRARIFNAASVEKWVDLSKLARNFQSNHLRASIDKDGLLTGVRNTTYSNQLAYDYKSRFAAAKDSVDYIKQIQNNDDITVDSLEISGKEPMSSNVNERLVFNKQMDLSGDFMYINPMIFKHLFKNPFTQSERKLPVEFAFPIGYQTICSIELPSNYQVEELPKSAKYIFQGGKAVCQFIAQQSENTIVFRYFFQMEQIVFSETEYPILRDFYGQVVAKNMETMVLKKKTQL
jgi:hypothetical protein